MQRTIPRTKQICRARAISVSDLVANSLLGNQPKDRKAKRTMTLDLTTSLINNHLPSNKDTVRKKCSIFCKIINEMARRPARCYRYCKNKVSTVFRNYAQCLLWAEDTACSASLTRTSSVTIRFDIIAYTQSPYSHIPSPASTVVSPIPKSAFST